MASGLCDHRPGNERQVPLLLNDFCAVACVGNRALVTVSVIIPLDILEVNYLLFFKASTATPRPTNDAVACVSRVDLRRKIA